MDKQPQWTIPAIEQKLCEEVAAVLRLASGSVTADTGLQSLGMDSLQFVSLLIKIEKTFGISLMKAGIRREMLKSVRTLAAAIHAGQGQ
jgi:acyl carrier protein